MSKAKQYEKNMADQRLVVGDLVVLGNMKGANLKSIERRVDLIQKQTQTIGKMATYWKNLADDGVITPSEKSQLLKEWKGIAESYSAIRTQAEQQGWQYNSIFVDYTTAYNALHDYLYGTLKLFDDMDSDTAISDKDAFDQYFADYYYAEKFTLLSFTTGIIENFQFIVLSSLTDEGHDGDYGLYRGVIYMYANGAWHKAGNGSYLGKYVSGIPYLSIGDFFLAAANFNANVYLATEDAEIIKANNKPLAVSIAFEKGFIYEGTVKGWKKVNNRNDWKYIIAVDDLISINAEIPEHLKSFVNITAKEAVPQYLGLLTVAPVLATNMYTPAGGNGQQEYHTGDWFTWGGATTANWGNLTLTKGRVYKYYGDEWVQLDEQDSTNGWYLMTALPDILSTLEAGAGYFSYIFANMLLANEAFINKLGAKVIELKHSTNESGILRSSNYSNTENNKAGFKIDTDGNADFFGDTNIKGATTIGGNVDIGGDVDIHGSITLNGVREIGITAGDILLKSFEKITNSRINYADFSCYIRANGTVKVGVKVYNRVYEMASTNDQKDRVIIMITGSDDEAHNFITDDENEVFCIVPMEAEKPIHVKVGLFFIETPMYVAETDAYIDINFYSNNFNFLVRYLSKFEYEILDREHAPYR